MGAPHGVGAFDLGAAAWPPVPYQGPPPLAPGSSRGGTAAHHQPRCCQVCAINLEGTPIYFQRIRACKEHVSANAVPLNGQVQRFCQQCSRFHPVENFDGTQRSCRQQLARHAERRRLLRRAKKGQAAQSSGQARQRQQQLQYEEEYPAKRHRVVPAPAPPLAAYPPGLALPPLALSAQPSLGQGLPPLPAPLHTAGLQHLGLDRADSGGSSDSQLGLPPAGSGGAPGAADPALVAALASLRQPEPQGTDQLTALLVRLAGQQGPAAAQPLLPAPPAPAAQPPLQQPAEQTLVSLLGALLEQQQAQQAQQRANAAAAIIGTLLQNQAPPPPAPALGSAFLLGGAAPQAPAAAPLHAPAPAPASAPIQPQPAAAPAADQPLAALLAQLVGSLAK